MVADPSQYPGVECSIGATPLIGSLVESKRAAADEKDGPCVSQEIALQRENTDLREVQDQWPRANERAVECIAAGRGGDGAGVDDGDGGTGEIDRALVEGEHAAPQYDGSRAEQVGIGDAGLRVEESH